MDLSEMRQINRKALFDIVRTKREVTRLELQQITGFSSPFIMEISNDFIEKNILVLTGKKTGAVGRRPFTMVFNPNVFLSIGIELAGNYIYAGIVNLDGEVTYQTRQMIESGDEFSAILKCIARLVRTGESVGIRCSAVGIALPGSVGEDEGGVYSIRSLWEGEADPTAGNTEKRGNSRKTYISEMLEEIRERYHIPVYFENDVNARAIGEHYLRQMQNHAPNDLIFISYTEFGLGAGIVIDGKLRKGQHALAGAIGSMVKDVDEQVAPHCKGALEARISREAIRQKFGIDLEEGHVPPEVIDHIASAVSPFIADILNILDFEQVALGGGLCDICGDALVDRIREYVSRQTLNACHVEKTLTEYSGVVGSALMASDFLCDLVL